MADIIVSMSGELNVHRLVADIKAKVTAAARKTVEEAGKEHIENAKTNINTAYMLGEYKQISLLYAWSFIPSDVKKANTTEENEALAKQIQATKTTMSRTGKLITGISIGTVTEGEEIIAIDLISSAPYSKNLEWGILFGKARGPASRRRFFTGHLHSITIPTMRRELLKNLREEML